MNHIYNSNAETIGKTPLVKLQRINKNNAATPIFAKIEARNPSYSVKCRIGTAMITDAINKKKLLPGMEIVEATSGNTGIALAAVGASLGIKVNLAMPESMSIERRKVLAHLGANLILTPASEGMNGAVKKAEELVLGDPEKFYLIQQFKNPANPQIHHDTTGPEIWNDTSGSMDVFIAGVGTGGTISGVSRFWKKTKNSPLITVAVEPAKSPIISQKLAGKPLQPSGHTIQGIGANFIPDNLDLSLLDLVEQITDEEALECAKRLAKEEGILCGISSGAAASVALRLAKRPEFSGKNLVCILPDAGERYLSTALFA